MCNGNFNSFLHPKVLEFIAFLDNQGCSVLVIGGTVRDFYLNQKNKHDYDLEIRPKAKVHDLLGFFESIEYPTNSSIVKLPYEIKRIEFEGLQVEISLPRKEIFTEEFHHSNFKAEFIEDPFFYDGFLRRDLTINAIGMLYSEGKWTLKDPLNGLQDLEKKRLSPCSDSFFKDPVRGLRALRFQMLTDFKIDKEIELFIKKNELSSYPASYLQSESKKSRKPIYFFITFLEFVMGHSLMNEKKYLKNNEMYDGEKLSEHLRKFLFLPDKVLTEICKILKIRPYKCIDVTSLSISKINFSVDEINNNREILEPFVQFLKMKKESKENLVRFYNLDKKVFLRTKKLDFTGIEPSIRKYYEAFIFFGDNNA